MNVRGQKREVNNSSPQRRTGKVRGHPVWSCSHGDGMWSQMGQTNFRTLKFQTTVMEVAAALPAWSRVDGHSSHFNP